MSDTWLAVESEARDKLERASLNPVVNRVTVLGVILESRRALSVKQVLKGVLQRGRINRVTVYRILDLLVENGLVNRIHSGDQGHLYCTGRNHSHFHCVSCGVVQCIDNVSLQFNEEAVVSASPMWVNKVDLHLEGTCSQCAVTME